MTLGGNSACEMSDTTGEESLFFTIQERHLIDIGHIVHQHIVFRPLNELAAEIDPHGYFLIIGATLVLAKLYGLVSRIGAWIDLVIAIVMHSAVYIIYTFAVREIVLANRQAITIVSSRRCHERVNKALKFLVVLEDIDITFLADTLYTHMNMQTAGLVDHSTNTIQHIAAGLQRRETIVVILKNWSYTLSGIGTINGAVSGELKDTTAVGMVVSLPNELKPIALVVDHIGIAHMIALNLYTKGEGLVAIEESGELKILNISRTKTQLNEHVLLLGYGAGALLNLIDLIGNGFHNTNTQPIF